MSNVFENPKEDLAQCIQMMKTLRDWQAKNWAIGLAYGGDHQPDGFYRFFAARGLPFDSYIRASDLSVGGPGAYDKNIRVLEDYAERVRAAEVQAVDSTIRTIRDWQARGWAIGLVYNSGQIDGFSTFLSLRGLTCHYYVRYGDLNVGDPSAYGAMVDELKGYQADLPEIPVMQTVTA